MIDSMTDQSEQKKGEKRRALNFCIQSRSEEGGTLNGGYVQCRAAQVACHVVGIPAMYLYLGTTLRYIFDQYFVLVSVINMFSIKLFVFSMFPSLFIFVNGRKLPEPEVQIEVIHKPLVCSRKSKYGDMLLVHYDGFLESNGTRFHSR